MSDFPKDKGNDNGFDTAQPITNEKTPEKRNGVEVAIFGIANALGIFFLLVSFFMVLLSPYLGGALSYIFLFSPILAVGVLVGINISNKRRSKTSAKTSGKRIKNYGLRLLTMFGVVFLGFITLFIMSIAFSIVTDQSLWVDNFWENIFSLILPLVIASLGALGVIRLIQLLRQ